MRYTLAGSLLTMVFMVGLWDIYVVAKGDYHDTVSSVIHHWSLMYPVLPLTLGLVLGHIFWPQVPRVVN